MKVLHVLHQFLPDYVGGTEVYVADLSRGLARRGHQLALFTGGDTETRGEWEGLPLTQVVGGLRSPKGLTAGFLATFGNASTEQAYKEVLAAFRPDIVHVHHLLGLSARLIRQTKALGIPVCCTLHDYWFMCPKSQLINHKGEPCNGPSGVNCARCAAERLGDGLYVAATIPAAPLFLLRERVVRRAYAAADRLLAPSHFLAGLAVQHGLPQEKLEVVEFGTMAAAAPERTPREAGSQPAGHLPGLAGVEQGCPRASEGLPPTAPRPGKATHRGGYERLPALCRQPAWRRRRIPHRVPGRGAP